MRATLETEYQHGFTLITLNPTTILYFLRGEMVAFEIPICIDEESDRTKIMCFMDRVFYDQIPLKEKQEVICDEADFEQAYWDYIGGSI
jgi:hypothetical protein